MHLKKDNIILIAILLVAIVVRFFDLARGNAVSDEVLYGFRAIGYIDFSFAWFQPSTWQLFDGDIPAWVKLSFHDHPPLVFIVQHLFTKVFGANLWGIRLPSVFFGVSSIYLVYLICHKLFSKKTGYLAAALMAVNVLMLYVSRTAMQESQVIFFIILSVYLFILSQNDKRWLMAVGASLGLGLLSKYTVGFLVLPFFAYSIIYDRKIFKDKFLYLGILIALLIFSPVIIYNILLFKNFGHFDFQLFYLFGQDVSYWQVTPGKEIGGIGTRVLGIFKNLWQYNSFTLNILSLGGLLYIIFNINKDLENKKYKLLLLFIFISNILLYFLVGSAVRFLTLLIPWLTILGSIFLVELFSKMKYIFIVLIIIIISWETFYSINSYIAYRPVGREVLTYSKIHWDMHDWGFNAVDEYLDDLLKDKYPAFTLPYTYSFLEDIRTKAINNHQDKDAVNLLIIYDDNIFDLASLWIFNRKSLYQGWPIITATTYKELLAANSLDALDQVDILFIKPIGSSLFVDADRMTGVSDNIQLELEEDGVVPQVINNSTGEAAFYIYYFDLDYLKSRNINK